MVIAEEMENAVQKQEGEFTNKRDLGFRCIAGRRLGRDHHIPEEKIFPPALLPFLLGKGDDIGRLIPLQILAIDLADTPIADDEDRQFGVRTSRDA